MKLYVKFTLLVSSLILATGLLSVFFVSQTMHEATVEKLEKQATLIGATMAEHITHSVINKEIVAVREALELFHGRMENVVYVYVVDFDGQVVAHTFEAKLPRVFLEHKPAEKITTGGIRKYSMGGEKILDVYYPLIPGMQAHLHIGMRERDPFAAMMILRIVGVAAVIILFGSLLAILLSRRITRPLSLLSDSLRSFGKGKTEKEIEYLGGAQEVAELTDSFNKMIVDKRRAEEGLRKSEHEKASVIEALNAASEVITYQATNMKVLWANAAAGESVGSTPEQLVGRYCYKIWCNSSEPCVGCPAEKALETGQSHENEITDPSGRIWLHRGAPVRGATGEIIGIVTTTLDITERKRAEEEILFKSTLLEAQSETSIDGILVVDSEGKTILSNRRFGEMWNIPNELLNTKDDEKILQYVSNHLEEPDKFLEQVRDLYAHKNEKSRDEIEFKDGKVFDRYSSPLLDASGKYYGRVWYFHDISDRKQAEEERKQYTTALEEARNNLEQKVQERTRELKEAHEALVRKEKLAVLGQLSSGVGHELRNPLGVIKNACYFLNMKMETIQDEAVKDNIGIMNREIDTANKIITDLLDFARIKEPMRQDTDINQLVAATLSKSLIPDNITVSSNFTEDMATVSIDPIQVGQIFLNLIENAVHAMGESGNLKISTRTADGATEAIFADNGCGIPKENLEKIFEPLFTTKAKGIGLGLSVSKSLAEANGASILVESEEGEGSRFTVRFVG